MDPIERARAAIDAVALLLDLRDDAVREAAASGLNPRQIARALGSQPGPVDGDRPRLSASQVRRITEAEQ